MNCLRWPLTTMFESASSLGPDISSAMTSMEEQRIERSRPAGRKLRFSSANARRSEPDFRDSALTRQISAELGGPSRAGCCRVLPRKRLLTCPALKRLSLKNYLILDYPRLHTPFNLQSLHSNDVFIAQLIPLRRQSMLCEVGKILHNSIKIKARE